MTAPLLEIRALSAHADGAAAALLDGIDLTVPAGVVAAVVGPSGSGKTILGLAALGASRPGVRPAGRVRLDGTDLLAVPEPRRRALRTGTAGHLPRDPETVLNPVRRIGGPLAELAASRHRARPDRRAAARAALATAGLPDPGLARRFPHQLSGGQQRRAALASALVAGARLLVLDEPTSGLDHVTASAISRRTAPRCCCSPTTSPRYGRPRPRSPLWSPVGCSPRRTPPIRRRVDRHDDRIIRFA